MCPSRFRMLWATALVTLMECWSAAVPGVAQQSPSLRIDDALQNITTVIRSGRVGYADFWDGNKYVQCKRTTIRELRCEAAGSTLQPSLRNVLTPERLTRLGTLGWHLDPAFGNYVQTFAADMPSSLSAEQIFKTLTEVYDINVQALEKQQDN